MGILSMRGSRKFCQMQSNFEVVVFLFFFCFFFLFFFGGGGGGKLMRGERIQIPL